MQYPQYSYPTAGGLEVTPPYYSVPPPLTNERLYTYHSESKHVPQPETYFDSHEHPSALEPLQISEQSVLSSYDTSYDSILPSLSSSKPGTSSHTYHIDTMDAGSSTEVHLPYGIHYAPSSSHVQYLHTPQAQASSPIIHVQEPEVIEKLPSTGSSSSDNTQNLKPKGSTSGRRRPWQGTLQFSASGRPRSKPMSQVMSSGLLDPVTGVLQTGDALAASFSVAEKVKKTYPCREEGCGKIFSRMFNLKSHMLTHTGARPFPCDHCDLTFRRKHDLIRHTRSLHSDTKPFSCPICHQVFARTDALKRHMLVEEKNAMELSASPPRAGTGHQANSKPPPARQSPSFGTD
ncbi:uncharacterized protein SPPG_01382 [Spizellomyces punctatus DAOM BR117]|uniref:C2H2-type domain-containing protein n=1 Tax=Spizellomyces punctatus (strain DAOM BR117) TaxID=645134 RepID=A0A0L0HS70_SPIPD|nr:uncharacterized protein SPPG_01382 [Spizellomyces punctatus DAOM BR117]KND03932.1 hypothetical protein SPPG_01382 [Spizellomyces punctatus DAOM BR117]|eukprot:XP_016611971.1 hypothetical protein SPPG_01382 [Spizellomyces punctatus DAOM BR117]